MDKQTTRVLIVEGDSDEASIIGTYLAGSSDQDGSFALTLAPRVSSAVNLLARQEFDVVLIDLVLPQSVGLDGFRKLHALKPHTPIIVLTGLQDVTLAIQAVKLGAHDYFIKGSPDFCLIKRAIRYALEKKRLTDDIEGLLEADAAPKLVVDAAGVVRYVNAAAAAALGRPLAELLDRPFGHALPAGDGETSIASSRAPETSVGLKIRSVSWQGEPARLLTLNDAGVSSELRRLEEEIKEGLRVVQVKNHFMSRISHELRNTLSTLTTAAYCLKDGIAGSLTPRQVLLVDMITRNVDRQTRIMENVLDLARFQSGKLKIQSRPVDLATLITQVVEESALAGAGPRLKAAPLPALPSIPGDPDLLAQVLRNLVINALRFARESVLIETSLAEADSVIVSVVDDGPGIPAERLGELFTAYVQLERPAAGSQYKGTGLGLIICKEIVTGHRGRIWAEARPGQGARFSFSLPRSPEPEKLFLEEEPKAPPFERRHAPVARERRR